MADHPALYGLMTGLPALSLSEPVAVHQPVWQLAADWLQPKERDILAVLYAPSQWSDYFGREADPTSLPAPAQWRSYASETTNADQPFRQALRAERAHWKSWLLAQPYPLLHTWLELQEELEHQRLEQLTAKHAWIQAAAVPSLGETYNEWPAADWSLWQHATGLYEQNLRTDQLLWHWLSEQVFYSPFTFDALLSYAIRQQMQHRWWVLGQAETTSLLENIIHESLA